MDFIAHLKFISPAAEKKGQGPTVLISLSLVERKRKE